MQKSTMNTEKEAQQSSDSSGASSSSADSQGNAEKIPDKELPPPYATEDVEDVEIAKMEDEEKSVSSASFDPWDIVEEEDTGTKWKGKTLSPTSLIHKFSSAQLLLLINVFFRQELN